MVRVVVLLCIPFLTCAAAVQFIFGDSLLDVGNNIRLTKSLARPALPWYGIDFGNGLPNGRFTNGRTVADIIGISFFLHAADCRYIIDLGTRVFYSFIFGTVNYMGTQLSTLLVPKE